MLKWIYYKEIDHNRGYSPVVSLRLIRNSRHANEIHKYLKSQ